MIKANYNLMSVSKLFTIFHKAECLENALSEKPQLAIGNLLIECGFEDMLQSAMTNIAACFLVWWKTKTRTVWRVSSETANYIKKVNLSFLPEIPPKSWNGNALLIESKAFDNPFIHDIFSLACYRIPDMQGIERYFFVCLQYPDGIFAFSITTNLFKINKKMAESGELFAPGFMIDNEYVDLQGVPPDEMREVAFDIIKFIFAFSYYIDSPKCWSSCKIYTLIV